MRRILSAIATLAFIIAGFSTGVQAEGETVKVLQVGTSGGIPAIQASVENASDTGTYSLVITNPKTNTTFSQTLNNQGKSTTFAVTNFTENGTYPYTLQVNGITLLEGGVNLVSAKRTPSFAVQLNGTDLTVDVTGGDDYIGQTISFTSGSYSNSIVLGEPQMQEAFEDATGLGDKMTFSSETGTLVTVSVKNIGGSSASTTTAPATQTPAPTQTPDNGGSGSTDTTTTTTPAPSTSQVRTTNNSSGDTSSQKRITIKLNQNSFKLEDTLVATIDITDTEYAGKSISLRFGADSNSSTKLVSLDKSGKASATFKIGIPQPSSKTITATTYSIAGSLLDTNSITYGITNEVAGSAGDGAVTATTGSRSTGGSSSDADSNFEDGEVPSAEYVSLDLTSLDQKKAVLAWYKADNISKYVTKVKVINTTTHDQHEYTVFMPDGDGKIDMNLIYDGPGIYTWELHSGGKLIAQAPYSTALGIDNPEPVSQNGLPVLKALANKDVYLTELDGVDPNAVNGASIGEEIGATADDVSGQTFDEPFNPEQQSEGQSKTLLLIAGIAVLVGGVAGGLLLYRRKKEQQSQVEEEEYEEYEDDEDDDLEDEDEENSPQESDEFEEVK